MPGAATVAGSESDAASRGPDAAAVAPMAMPFKKSRRVMGWSMPSKRSRRRSCFSCVMAYLLNGWGGKLYRPGWTCPDPELLACPYPRTVYNDSHWLHIQVTHVGPYSPSNSDPQAHSRRHRGERNAAYACGDRAHSGLQVAECRRGTPARLAAQGRHRSHPRRFTRHSVEGHSA